MTDEQLNIIRIIKFKILSEIVSYNLVGLCPPHYLNIDINILYHAKLIPDYTTSINELIEGLSNYFPVNNIAFQYKNTDVIQVKYTGDGTDLITYYTESLLEYAQDIRMYVNNARRGRK